MTMFLTGFLVCWVVLGAFALIAERFAWESNDLFWVVLALPFFVLFAPILFVYLTFIRPWRNVWKPVERKRFQTMVQVSRGKQICIGSRFYICFDGAAKSPFDKIFFVRIQKEAHQ